MLCNYLLIGFIDSRCVCIVNKHKTSEGFKVKECIWDMYMFPTLEYCFPVLFNCVLLGACAGTLSPFAL